MACGGNSAPKAEPTPCPTVEPVDDTSMLPKDVPFADFGDVVEIAQDDDFVNARAYSDGLIVEIDPQMQRELIAEKYQIVGHDNEGFEAEIFFARGSETVGTIQMREGPCEGIVTLLLTYTSPEKKKADG